MGIVLVVQDSFKVYKYRGFQGLQRLSNLFSEGRRVHDGSIQ